MAMKFFWNSKILPFHHFTEKPRDFCSKRPRDFCSKRPRDFFQNYELVEKRPRDFCNLQISLGPLQISLGLLQKSLGLFTNISWPFAESQRSLGLSQKSLGHSKGREVRFNLGYAGPVSPNFVLTRVGLFCGTKSPHDLSTVNNEHSWRWPWLLINSIVSNCT